MILIDTIFYPLSFRFSPLACRSRRQLFSAKRIKNIKLCTKDRPQPLSLILGLSCYQGKSTGVANVFFTTNTICDNCWKETFKFTSFSTSNMIMHSHTQQGLLSFNYQYYCRMSHYYIRCSCSMYKGLTITFVKFRYCYHYLLERLFSVSKLHFLSLQKNLPQKLISISLYAQFIQQGKMFGQNSQANHWLAYLGSLVSVHPRPYIGTTLSLEIAALQTGHVCLLGLVSSH